MFVGKCSKVKKCRPKYEKIFKLFKLENIICSFVVCENIWFGSFRSLKSEFYGEINRTIL